MNEELELFGCNASVLAPISYLVPMREKPTTYVSAPPKGIPKQNARYEERRSKISNARPIRNMLSLDREGFLLVNHVSATEDFWNDEEVLNVYYREAQEIVRMLTGAREVHVFDHTRRRRVSRLETLSGNQLSFSDVRTPVGKAHSDFTPSSARSRLEIELGIQAADLGGRRFAIINVWRPLNLEPIQDSPLALLDASSVSPEDFVASNLIYDDRVGETYNLTFSEKHRWFYFPDQLRSEVIVFKNFDTEGPAPFAPHSAFENPLAPHDALMRESIEVRVFALY